MLGGVGELWAEYGNVGFVRVGPLRVYRKLTCLKRKQARKNHTFDHKEKPQVELANIY